MTLVISTLRGGGAERVVSNMANYWARKGWPVTVLTVAHGSESPYYNLDPQVVHRDMEFYRSARQSIPNAGALRALKEIFDDCSPPERRVLIPELYLISELRRAIIDTRPQVVISFIHLTNIRVLLATQGLGLPVIVSERDDPYRDPIPEGATQLRRRLYPMAKYMVAQTEEAADYFAAEVGDRRRAIPNPVLQPALPARGDSEGAGRILVGMGRLVEDKGFNLLLSAFSKVAHNHPSWSLQIWGEGPQRYALEQMARDLNLSHRVELPGFTRRPFEALSRADLFAMSSLVEGFPNALCEAMACGLPVVSFNCSSGIRQIIRDGLDGLIVRAADPTALALALDRLMADEEERRRLAGKAIEITDRFGLDKTMARWEQLVLDSV
ncbi:MAG TPA: glycosyltransferase family 4 protein [Blastocatellia bacterium]|nr:glycosyltransferase family 4 protein [Blastocatellia bacterium]